MGQRGPGAGPAARPSGPPLAVRACRWVSSALLAVALAPVAMVACAIVRAAVAPEPGAGAGAGACALTALAGPVAMGILHRPFHARRWPARACALVGGLGIGAAVLLYGRMDAAAAAHVPAGPFSGLGFAVGQVLAILGGAASAAACLGGALGILAGRLEARAGGDRP